MSAALSPAARAVLARLDAGQIEDRYRGFRAMTAFDSTR